MLLSVAAIAAPAPAWGKTCLRGVAEYMRPDTPEEARYPGLSRSGRRDFAAAMRMLRERQPPPIGLPIIERVLYRMNVGDAGVDAAWDTVIRVEDLKPGQLDWMAARLEEMPAAPTQFLSEVKERLNRLVKNSLRSFFDSPAAECERWAG